MAKYPDKPPTFTLWPEEWEVARKWLETHECKHRRKSMGAAGGSTTYEFTPTGIGTAVVVKCSCGAEVNATNYGSW